MKIIRRCYIVRKSPGTCNSIFKRLITPVIHQKVDLTEEKLVEIYKKMFLLSQMDKILLQSQRQGRITFYMTCSGEEASVIGIVPLLSLLFFSCIYC